MNVMYRVELSQADRDEFPALVSGGVTPAVNVLDVHYRAKLAGKMARAYSKPISLAEAA